MSFLTFTSDQQRIINEFINSSTKPNVECEIRFGSFVFNRDTKQSTFISNAEIDFFYRLKRSFSSQGFQTIETSTSESIYKSERGSMKKIQNTKNNETTYILKNTFKKYNMFDYGFRLSLANETKQNSNQLGDQVVMNRQKTRTSFILPIGSLDMTIVKEHDLQTNKHEQKYEIELEIKSKNYNEVEQFLTVILQTRQENFFVISNTERKNVIGGYKNLVKTHFFIGAQPETLQKTEIHTLYKNLYSVTDKADGERMLMYIDNLTVYFIDNNINKIYKTNVTSKMYNNTLIDGELISVDNKIYFLAFDLIAYNGKDIRGNKEYMLSTRLNRIKDILSNLQNPNDFYVIQPKKFLFKNVFLGSEIILETANKKPYKNDGLIFTPMNEPYPLTKKWPQLLKWKPAELNTIDFYSVRNESDPLMWSLYVQHQQQNKEQINQPKQQLKTEKALFDITKLCSEHKNIECITYQTIFDPETIDPSSGEPFQSNTVIEYSWNKQLNKFVPLRTRWDKTANPKKHGNFSSVACDIWNNIHNPVDKEMLFKFTAFSSAKEDLFFERMRKYHNKIKEYLYNKYTKDCEYLLELCSGKGGDMHKWLYNNIGNVVGYDISDKNIGECRRRILSSQTNQNSSYNFYQMDLCQNEGSTIIQSNNPDGFDNICCHFGVHYFFNSQNSFGNLIRILKTSLHDNGHFIVTFMDNSALNELYNNCGVDNGVVYKEKNDQIVYYMKRDMKYDSQNSFGNGLRIILNGNNILTEGSNEYIIDYSQFVNAMNENGFKLIESELFKNVTCAENYKTSLTQEERDISFLNRYCVFKKNSTSEDTLITPQCSIIYAPQYNTKEYSSFTLTDLHQHNLSVYKIATSYDLIDVMNCIEYKYYKHVIANGDIVTFEDISNIFRSMSITYEPIFVENPYQLQSYSKTDNCIHFTYYKNQIDKKNADGEIEQIEYDNWYVILNKNKLVFKNTDISLNEDKSAQCTNKISKVEEKKTENTYETALLNPKITLKQLKDIAAELGLKVSGKKEELHIRITNHLQNN